MSVSAGETSVNARVCVRGGDEDGRGRAHCEWKDKDSEEGGGGADSYVLQGDILMSIFMSGSPYVCARAEGTGRARVTGRIGGKMPML